MLTPSESLRKAVKVTAQEDHKQNNERTSDRSNKYPPQILRRYRIYKNTHTITIYCNLSSCVSVVRPYLLKMKWVPWVEKICYLMPLTNCLKLYSRLGDINHTDSTNPNAIYIAHLILLTYKELGSYIKNCLLLQIVTTTPKYVRLA